VSNPIQQALDPLLGAVVVGFYPGLMDHTLALDLRVHDGGTAITHTLRFSGVSAFYSVLGDGGDRFRYVQASFEALQLLTIEHVSGGVGLVHMGEHTPPWWGEFPSQPTFALELSGAWLFIEASCVTVDNAAFQVEQPSS
jgi:hypothetical protein